MTRPSLIVLAICLVGAQAPSSTYANSLEDGPVDIRALKNAPLGRRNFPVFGWGAHPGGEQEEDSYGSGGYAGKAHPGLGKDDSQAGILGFGNGGYGGSNPVVESSPIQAASGSYGPGKKGYHSEPEKKDPSAEDSSYAPPSKSHDSGKGSTSDYQDPSRPSPAKPNPGKNSQPPAKYPPKSSDGGDYPKKKDPKKTGGYGSSSGKHNGKGGYSQNKEPKKSDKDATPSGKQDGQDGGDKKSDEEGSFIFEEGTTDEQLKAAQEEAKKNSSYKKPDPHGGNVKPPSEKNSSGDQSYGRPHVASGPKDGDSSYN